MLRLGYSHGVAYAGNNYGISGLGTSLNCVLDSSNCFVYSQPDLLSHSRDCFFVRHFYNYGDHGNVTLGSTPLDVVSVDSGTTNSRAYALCDFSAGLTLKLEGCINSHYQGWSVLLYEFLHSEPGLSDAAAWTLRTDQQEGSPVEARLVHYGVMFDLPSMID